jgi:hypothetical protein
MKREEGSGRGREVGGGRDEDRERMLGRRKRGG